MPDAIHPNDEALEIYDDFEEYVDLDEHQSARAYAHRRKIQEEQEFERHEDFLDEYHYGEDSGEAYEEEST